MRKAPVAAATLLLVAGVGGAATFHIRSQKTGRAYGPFEFADGASVAIGQTRLTLRVAEDNAQQFTLRSEKTARVYGPFTFQDGAELTIGRSTYALVLPGAEPKERLPAMGWEERYSKKGAEAALAKGDMAEVIAIGRMAQAQVDTAKNAMATIVHKLGKEETPEYKEAVEKAKAFARLFPGLSEGDQRSIEALRAFTRAVGEFETTVPLPARNVPPKGSRVHVSLGIQLRYDKDADEIADKCVLAITEDQETLTAGLTDSYGKLDWAIIAKLTDRLVAAGVEGYTGPSVREMLGKGKAPEQ